MKYVIQDYTRIVERWEHLSEAQREAVINGCILQQNTLCPDQFMIAPALLPDFAPIRSSYRNPA